MHRWGHFGAALLVYAPVGATLLAGGFDAAALVGGLVVVSLSTLPDVDHGLPFVEHRGATHTVGFALLVGVVVGAAGVALGASTAGSLAPSGGAGVSLDTVGGLPTAGRLGAFGFLLGVLAVASHLLGDVLTPKGITPFRPVSRAHYTVSLCRADNVAANLVLLTAGVAVTVAVLLAARL
ncbi:metal-dependent hydrolase [Halosimplex aquaticum]|uniref:Metal-dependent hydrolase n=1 Tax=Halosimplex aquaticum TaxID=3026162 RepID=A0ABD5YE73_9EURY|nr:metal-dependent hydrolase [Halosimplex aquaticum]